jgi:uncharacterized protein YmfQ (DUF2313 family)
MPTPAIHSASDYTSLLQRLMPRGRAWPRDQDAVQTVALGGFALGPQRVDAAASGLIPAAFPATATYLLGEWEETLGLPARFGGPVGTTSQRQADVVASLTGLGGQSIAYFVTYAAQLGYSITIEQFKPWVCTDDCDAPIDGLEWAFAWEVDVAIGTDVTRLRNMLNLYKPAHTTPFIVFV